MYSITAHPHLFHQASVPTSSHFQSQDIRLILRQQPKEALITTEGKEKARKPVDPPPIIQLQVEHRADPTQNYLQSPYLFMCTSLWKATKDEAWDGIASKSLSGSLVSSLHRLKDVDNKDGGFFVFGDISVKVQGAFRLHFSLFDLHKDTNEVQFLGSITSHPFKVMLPKDFKGMDESTYLSRAFSDQGVRLRLRKEPRAMIGNKRSYPYGMDAPSNAPIRPNVPDYSYEDDSALPNKRLRADTEDRKENYPHHTVSSSASFPPSFPSSSYSVRQTTLPGSYSMGQSSFSGGLTSGSPVPSSPYQFRPNLANTSNFYSNSLMATASTRALSGTMPSQSRYTESLLPTSGAGSQSDTAGASQHRYAEPLLPSPGSASRYSDLQQPFELYQGYDQPRGTY